MCSIKVLVNNLIKKYGTNDPFEIAKRLNIIVVDEELGNTLGFYSSHKRFKFIHLNNKLEGSERNFVCSHELGHVIIHPKSNTPFLRKNTFFSIDKIEVEANTFAVELLLPDTKINEYIDTNISIYDVAKSQGIPAELIRLKKY